MSYEFYKVLHLIGLVTLFASLGALTVIPPERRKPFIALHGTATLIMMVAGFGLIAKLGLMANMGAWLYGKMLIWVVLGATPVILRKKPDMAFSILLFSLALGAISATLAIYKPGL